MLSVDNSNQTNGLGQHQSQGKTGSTRRGFASQLTS